MNNNTTPFRQLISSLPEYKSILALNYVDISPNRKTSSVIFQLNNTDIKYGIFESGYIRKQIHPKSQWGVVISSSRNNTYQTLMTDLLRLCQKTALREQKKNFCLSKIYLNEKNDLCIAYEERNIENYNFRRSCVSHVVKSLTTPPPVNLSKRNNVVKLTLILNWWEYFARNIHAIDEKVLSKLIETLLVLKVATAGYQGIDYQLTRLDQLIRLLSVSTSPMQIK